MGKSKKRVRIDTKTPPPRANARSASQRSEERAPKRGFEGGGPRMSEDEARSKLQRFLWKKGMLAARKGSVSTVVVQPSKMESVTRMADRVEKEYRRVKRHNVDGDLEGETLFRGMQQQAPSSPRLPNPHRRPSSIGAVNLGAPTTAADDAARRNDRRRAARLEARRARRRLPRRPRADAGLRGPRDLRRHHRFGLGHVRDP